MDAAAPASTDSPRGLSRTACVAMALGAGVIVANLYYAQPIVSLIADDLRMSPLAASLIVTVSQLGYAAGLIFLVPLGDIIENKRLILCTVSALIVSLGALLLANSEATLFAAMLVVGCCSAAAQMIVPLAANLAPPEQRGRVVGDIMVGLLGGILVARPISSFVAGSIGWHGIFAMSAVVSILVLILAWLSFPARRPANRANYPRLIASLGRLFLEQPILRRRALYQGAMFATFAMFWTGAPIILMRPPFELEPIWIALFTLTGVMGLFAAPVAGRAADRGRARQGTIIAISLAAFAMAVALLGQTSFAAMIAAGILIDLGVQANLVIGQREIFQLDERIRSRLNAVYMATFFMGGALGSSLTSPLLENFGWRGVALAAMAFPMVPLLYLLVAEGRSAR